MYYLGEASDLAEVVSITAVEVFFVLSGFVLGPQIVLCARRRNWATLRTFLLRRWMRTIPSYLVALLAHFGGLPRARLGGFLPLCRLRTESVLSV